MGERAEIWGLVLAAGEGTRLAGWSRDAEGLPAPKQFCALDGERTLLERTYERLSRTVSRRRMVTVVAEAHRSHWGRMTGATTDGFVVQPVSRGTAAGILLPLLEILSRDPDARVVVCPSDQAVADERRFGRSLTQALAALERPLDKILLLGMEPDSPEEDYGWIVPTAAGCSCASPRPVSRFVEKPGRAAAEDLARAGGLWNSFWTVARARTLAALYQEREPGLWRALSSAHALPAETRQRALGELYRSLPERDFSRHLLQGAEERLGVVVVPPCGWTDLGTPERLLRFREPRRRPPIAAWPAFGPGVAVGGGVMPPLDAARAAALR